MSRCDDSRQPEDRSKDNTISKEPVTIPIGRKIKWDHKEDNCGINPDENPCGDANEY